jgi:hypothetical protein
LQIGVRPGIVCKTVSQKKPITKQGLAEWLKVNVLHSSSSPKKKKIPDNWFQPSALKEMGPTPNSLLDSA